MLDKDTGSSEEPIHPIEIIVSVGLGLCMLISLFMFWMFTSTAYCTGTGVACDPNAMRRCAAIGPTGIVSFGLLSVILILGFQRKTRFGRMIWAIMFVLALCILPSILETVIILLSNIDTTCYG